jgi:hypothetical protein
MGLLYLCFIKGSCLVVYENPVSTTAPVASDRSGGNVLDDVHLFIGEEMQWRILIAIA